MSTLQQALNEALTALPYEVFAEMIAGKLAAKGVTLTARERRQLTERLKSNTGDVFRFRGWQWWADQQVNVKVTEEEVEAIHGRFAEFLEGQLPGLIKSMIENLSVDILQTLTRHWSAESRHQIRQRRGFERRLHKRWGPGLDRLRMFLAIAREFGANINSELRASPGFAHPPLLDVLTRLHARACQVTEEIVCLLSSGFADGAMARWRTLHEIAVVAIFLKEGDEDLAERYLAHEVVESFRAAREYQLYSERLGYEPMSIPEFDKIRQDRDDVVGRYGTPFNSQYGWAAEALRLQQPTLWDIERAAGISHLRPYYRMASHNLHANPKGVFFKLGLVDEADILLAGPSNSGLADPGHGAAISLLQVSTALGLIEPNLDSLVGLRILARLADEVGESLISAHRELEDDISQQAR